MYGTRGLRGRVVRTLAKLGLIWALTVLGVLFMTMTAQGPDPDAGRRSAVNAPSTAGIALAMLVVAGGVTVLAIGAARGDRARETPEPLEPLEADPAAGPDSDLPLALALGSLA